MRTLLITLDRMAMVFIQCRSGPGSGGNGGDNEGDDNNPVYRQHCSTNKNKRNAEKSSNRLVRDGLVVCRRGE